MPTVTCRSCRHDADLANPADVWKCNCAAQGGGCDCDALNEDPGTEDNPADSSGEIADLEARLLKLRGGVAAKGHTNA